jgi:hypothetical protein
MTHGLGVIIELIRAVSRCCKQLNWSLPVSKTASAADRAQHPTAMWPPCSSSAATRARTGMLKLPACCCCLSTPSISHSRFASARAAKVEPRRSPLPPCSSRPHSTATAAPFVESSTPAVAPRPALPPPPTSVAIRALVRCESTSPPLRYSPERHCT